MRSITTALAAACILASAGAAQQPYEYAPAPAKPKARKPRKGPVAQRPHKSAPKVHPMIAARHVHPRHKRAEAMRLAAEVSK
jgi:hypothetical protein